MLLYALLMRVPQCDCYEEINQLGKVIPFCLGQVGLLVFSEYGKQVQWNSIVVVVVDDANSAALALVSTPPPEFSNSSCTYHYDTGTWMCGEIVDCGFAFFFAEERAGLADEFRQFRDGGEHVWECNPMDHLGQGVNFWPMLYRLPISPTMTRSAKCCGRFGPLTCPCPDRP